MKTPRFFALGLVVALLVPSLTFAAPGEKGARAGRGPEARVKMLTEKLSLTEDQQKKVREIISKNASELRGPAGKGRKNMSEEERQKAREILRGQMKEIGAILTPEQKQKLKAMRAERAKSPGAKKAK